MSKADVLHSIVRGPFAGGKSNRITIY